MSTTIDPQTSLALTGDAAKNGATPPTNGSPTGEQKKGKFGLGEYTHLTISKEQLLGLGMTDNQVLNYRKKLAKRDELIGKVNVAKLAVEAAKEAATQPKLAKSKREELTTKYNNAETAAKIPAGQLAGVESELMELLQKAELKKQAKIDKEPSPEDAAIALAIKDNLPVALTEAEATRLAQLEEAALVAKAQGQKAVLEIGRVVNAVFKEKLYKGIGAGEKGFIQWGTELLGLEVASLYRYKDFSAQHDMLAIAPKNPEIAENTPDGKVNFFNRLPENERQSRALKQAGSFDNQAVVWREVCNRVGENGKITEAIILSVCESLFPKKKKPVTKVGDERRKIGTDFVEQGMNTMQLPESPLVFNSGESYANWRGIKFITTWRESVDRVKTYGLAVILPNEERRESTETFSTQKAAMEAANAYAREAAKDQWEEDVKSNAAASPVGEDDEEPDDGKFYYVSVDDGVCSTFASDEELGDDEKANLGYSKVLGPFVSKSEADDAAENYDASEEDDEEENPFAGEDEE